jgi:hypothetical protein
MQLGYRGNARVSLFQHYVPDTRGQTFRHRLHCSLTLVFLLRPRATGYLLTCLQGERVGSGRDRRTSAWDLERRQRKGAKSATQNGPKAGVHT